jgi:hypothetical protein
VTMADRPRTPDASLAWALTALAVVIFVARAWGTLDTVVDDAWISARYARNLALGHGLVFNAGAPPVEGYTNLAFVVLLAGLFRAGADMHAAMIGLGLGFGVLGLFCATALTRAVTDRPSALDALPALILAVDAHYAVVATNGIESSMFVCGVLGASAAVLAAEGRWRWAAGVVAGLLASVRPEGVAVAAALAGWARLRPRGAWGRVSSWPVAICVVALSAPVWLGRQWYFGSWTPNTFDAKAHKDLAKQIGFNLDYLGQDGPFWLGAAALFVAALVLPPRNDRKAAVAVIAAGLTAVAFSVDMWMPGGRLLLPAVSLGLCLFGASLSEIGVGLRAGAVLYALLAVPLLVGPLPKHVFGYDNRHTALPGNGAQLAAEHLAAHAPPGAVMVTRDAGVFCYFVGPDVTALEIHPRALTQPHPAGKDIDVTDFVPKNPEFIALTVQRENQERSKYSTDQQVFRRTTEEYDYLGRVYQHFHRYYDVYARSDLNVPPLPDAIVVNKKGQTKRPGAPASTAPERDAADTEGSAETDE